MDYLKSVWSLCIRFGWTIFLLLAAIVAVLWFVSVNSPPAHADGYEGGAKDTIPGYSDPYRATRRQIYQYRADPISYGPGAELRRHLSPDDRAELKRIHRRTLKRMERDRRVFSRSLRRNGRTDFRSGPILPPARYAQRSRYDVRDTKECRGSVDVTGHERLGRGRAERSAYNAWSAAVRDRPGLGGRYSDIDNARGVNLSCYKARGNLLKVYVCSLSARPCRGI